MAATKKAMAKVTEIQDKEDKKRALNTAMAQIEREFGAGAIMKLGENTHMEVQAVSTGSLSLDMALGIPRPSTICSLIISVCPVAPGSRSAMWPTVTPIPACMC